MLVGLGRDTAPRHLITLFYWQLRNQAAAEVAANQAARDTDPSEPSVADLVQLVQLVQLVDLLSCKKD